MNPRMGKSSDQGRVISKSKTSNTEVKQEEGSKPDICTSKTAAEILAERQQRAKIRKEKQAKKESVAALDGSKLAPSSPSSKVTIAGGGGGGGGGEGESKPPGSTSQLLKLPEGHSREHVEATLPIQKPKQEKVPTKHQSDLADSHKSVQSPANRRPVVVLESGSRLMTPNRLKKIAAMYSTADPMQTTVEFTTSLRSFGDTSLNKVGWSASHKMDKAPVHVQETTLSGRPLAETLKARHARTDKKLPGQLCVCIDCMFLCLRDMQMHACVHAYTQ